MENYAEESRSFRYDVFLSFRGEDTRDGFIGYLRNELRRKEIRTFFDADNLRIGEGISHALSEAIEESQISIIVFSQDYASSTWCLNELVKILECTKRNSKQLAFPIFYHVDPADVRHQRNSYREAMIAHQNRFGDDDKNIQAWISALSEAATLKGHHIETRSEIDHIKDIVEKVSANIAPKPFQVVEETVGLEHRVEYVVKSLLDMKPNDGTVCMLGIYGLGGIGKTELAKALYNKIVHQFDAASFLADVREKSNKNKGLEDLQKTLLSEMLEELEIELGSTSRGIYEIKRKLGEKRVLLVLDDVDDRKQLNNLAGACDWFGSGSRIIITTRDKQLLIGHQVQKMYEMTELNDQHSLDLFCQIAFGMSHPKTGYEDMSSRAVGYAKGHPLALKVIGSDLATEKCLEDWENALNEYERSPPKHIQDVLKISIDKLGQDAKDVFLDIACFFKGERIKYVEKILEGFGATSNIKELVNKSLLTVEYGCLNMHDLIQDMGREIVKQKAQNPGQRSRLWFYKDVIEVLTQDSGSNAIEGIMLDPPQHEVVDWSGTAFKEMKWLRILIVRNTSFTLEPTHLPDCLRLLDWEEYPSRFFPPNFYPMNIIVFNLTNSQLTMEKPFKKFSCLTNMNFSHNQSIIVMPDVSEVQNLRELRLDNCKNLITVHESIGFLKYLVHLSASGCTKLRTFLQRMFLPFLEVLDLNLCINLEHFPEIENNMDKPLKIYMMNTAIKELPSSIGNLTGLVSMEIPRSKKLKHIPSSLFMLPNFVAFKLGGCSQLGEFFRKFLQSPLASNGHLALKTLYFENGGLSDEDLHAILICFPKLEELIASENNFISLPVCIKECIHLTSLDVSVCRDLKKIPECINLKILDVHDCVGLEHISLLPSTTQKVDVRCCFNLTGETFDMLWNQVTKEIHGLEIVMPQTEIPRWFDYNGKEGNPHFWAARGKFPIVALALVFEDVSEKAEHSHKQLVDLHLIINGQCVPRKGYYNFRIAPANVLVCDLRLLFSDEEWRGLDAFLKHEWNHVLVYYEAEPTMTLRQWGVFVYKQGTNNMENVQIMCPNPMYSCLANISSIRAPKRDPKQKQRKMIEKLGIDKKYEEMLKEIERYEERNSAMLEQISGVKEISTQAKDILEGRALYDKRSKLGRFLKTVGKLDDVKDEIKPPMNAGEASTSGHRGSLEVQVSNPQQQEKMMGIFLDGMGAGLLEAKISFPSLDIDTTMSAALSKGVIWPLPESEVYMQGILNGLQEAKLSFPTLDVVETLNTVLNRGAYKGPIKAPPAVPLLDWSKVMVPNSDDPLLQAFMMMKQESCKSDAKSKLYCKLMEEHKALLKKFEELEHETATPDNDSFLIPSVKNQYDKLIQKLNTQSALSSTEMHTDIGKEGCKGCAEYEKLAAVLKGRAEELQGLYDTGIEGFQNSEESHDLVSAIYLNGLGDGLLEALAILQNSGHGQNNSSA